MCTRFNHLYCVGITDGNELMAYLVWVKSNGIVWPVKWFHNPINSETGKPRDEGVLQKHKLSDIEAQMSINELKNIYPMKENTNG